MKNEELSLFFAFCLLHFAFTYRWKRQGGGKRCPEFFAPMELCGEDPWEVEAGTKALKDEVLKERIS